MQLVSDGTLGTNNKIIAASAQFSNMGTLLLRDGQPNGRNLILADSSILINEATISFEGDQADLVQAGTGNRILNFGTINKTQGQGLSNINVRLENSRTLDVQSGTLAFGETFIHQTGAILQGQANFDLPISNDFTNLGITNPGDITTTARLTFLGDYKLPPNAQLSIDVNGPVPISQYDQVQVTGTATLEGAIALNLNYTPSCQDTLRILQAGQITNCSLPDTLFASLGSSFVPYLVDCRSDAVLLIPQLQELCGDGIDNDCDGQIDEGCTIPLRQPQSVAQVQPEEWQVFPNPVRDVLHLKFTAQSIPSGRLLLTNSLGQQVEGWKLSGQGLSSSFSLQIGHLAAGLYTLSWEQSGIVSSKRIKILPR